MLTLYLVDMIFFSPNTKVGSQSPVHSLADMNAFYRDANSSGAMFRAGWSRMAAALPSLPPSARNRTRKFSKLLVYNRKEPAAGEQNCVLTP
jgi:hypothetical protein